MNYNIKDNPSDFRKMVVFEVLISKGRTVYMSASETNYENDNRAIVIVNAKKFLDLWKNDPHSEHHKIANGNPATWRRDKKYLDAERGFGYGESNPVPLANASFFEANPIVSSRQYIRFTNGVTRTIWLLTNDCLEFPVECSLSGGAEGLYKAIGTNGTSFNTVADILKLSL